MECPVTLFRSDSAPPACPMSSSHSRHVTRGSWSRDLLLNCLHIFLANWLSFVSEALKKEKQYNQCNAQCSFSSLNSHNNIIKQKDEDNTVKMSIDYIL